MTTGWRSGALRDEPQWNQESTRVIYCESERNSRRRLQRVCTSFVSIYRGEIDPINEQLNNSLYLPITSVVILKYFVES